MGGGWAGQHKCYIVATCDRDLKRRIRKIPGVPIMFISAHRYSIERLPEATIGGGEMLCTVKEGQSVYVGVVLSMIRSLWNYVKEFFWCKYFGAFGLLLVVAWVSFQVTTPVYNKACRTSCHSMATSWHNLVFLCLVGGVQLHALNEDDASWQLVRCTQGFGWTRKRVACCT